jgi:hypothetical protein
MIARDTVCDVEMGGGSNKVRRLLGFATREVRETRALRRQIGLTRALTTRIRANLELGHVRDAIAALEREVAELRERPVGPGEEVVQRLGGVERQAGALAQESAGLRADLEAAHDRLQHVDARLQRADTELGAVADRLQDLREVIATTAWAATLPSTGVLVSVIMPTRNRAGLLPQAIASVRAQTHTAWELIVVDHGSEDDTARVLEGIDDERIRVVRVDREDGQGVGEALNAGLAIASGELIAYLDDDNRMLPHWLAAVVWGFAEHPGADVLYGARLLQLDDRGIPDVHLLPWDRRSIERFNIADQNVTAHRAGLAEAVYDGTLLSATDWDFLLRTTEHKPPLRLPVLAVAYRRDAPGRVTDQPETRREYVRVQQRVLRRRPLRVLGVNAMFPLVTETYIHDELHALEQQGAQLAWFRAQPAPAPMPVSQPVYDDIDEAVREFDPDLLMVYWLDYAAGELERLERIGRPFGVRAHSFDRYPELAERLAAHPLCLGVWTYPRSPFAEMGTHALVPIFSSVDRLPEPAAERDVIASMSAGLPKKDWPLLFDAFGRLSGHDRRIVVGVTLGYEHVPGELAALAAACPDPPLLQINLVREQALALLMRTSVLVYTLLPEVGFAMPMSVVEGLSAGCCVVLPDRPECREFAGPGFRGYRTADDIVRHVLEVRAGGPAIDAEREANRAWAGERFCDPELGRRFHAELLAAMDDMRARAMGFPLPSLTGARDRAQAMRASAAISLA